jgi:hypothetical protein
VYDAIVGDVGGMSVLPLLYGLSCVEIPLMIVDGHKWNIGFYLVGGELAVSFFDPAPGFRLKVEHGEVVIAFDGKCIGGDADPINGARFAGGRHEESVLVPPAAGQREVTPLEGAGTGTGGISAAAQNIGNELMGLVLARVLELPVDCNAARTWLDVPGMKRRCAETAIAILEAIAAPLGDGSAFRVLHIDRDFDALHTFFSQPPRPVARAGEPRAWSPERRAGIVTGVATFAESAAGQFYDAFESNRAGAGFVTGTRDLRNWDISQAFTREFVRFAGRRLDIVLEHLETWLAEP